MAFKTFSIMKTFKPIIISAAVLLAVSCGSSKTGEADYNVIPVPENITLTSDEAFILDGKTGVVCSEELQNEASFLRRYVLEQSAVELRGEEAAKTISLVLDESLGGEAYRITVEPSCVTVAGGSPAGVFYGVQTLRKSLPVGRFGKVALPAGTVESSPRFGYRGMLLDVVRHYSDADMVKKVIDILALHNANVFHWHLTDDQGWRVEIKAYPELASVASARKETVIGRNTGEYDGIPYGEGCWFTQEQVREIVAYAAERHIEVIPEIDMPGHMIAALQVYPELGCTGGPYEVWTKWGVSEDLLCAGNDATLEFTRNVLAEIIDMFPSKYIHIGGDECPKDRWAACPKCQARIKKHNLKADKIAHSPEEALQGWFMSEMADFLGEHGRTAVGWDEILENDQLDGNTVIMSWRGTEGGIAAAERGFDAIMVPQRPMYFDHYQTMDVNREPLAIGGYNPVENVYAFEPTDGIKEEYQKHIIGVQANLWTEYVLSDEHVMHMILPRLAALSEVQWRDAGTGDYEAFRERLPHMFDIYRNCGYNYAPYILDVKCEFKPSPADRTINVELSTLGDAEIRYTLDGTVPSEKSPLYTGPVAVNATADFSAAAFRNGEMSDVASEHISFSESTLRGITLENAPASNYTFNGASTLVDGFTGNRSYRTGRWIGFHRCDCDAVIDLGSEKKISAVDFGVCINTIDHCFDARGAKVMVSNDGVGFTEVAHAEYEPVASNTEGVNRHVLEFDPVDARYVKVVVLHERSIPQWHDSAAGKAAFLFVDEIAVK